MTFKLYGILEVQPTKEDHICLKSAATGWIADSVAAEVSFFFGQPSHVGAWLLSLSIPPGTWHGIPSRFLNNLIKWNDDNSSLPGSLSYDCIFGDFNVNCYWNGLVYLGFHRIPMCITQNQVAYKSDSCFHIPSTNTTCRTHKELLTCSTSQEKSTYITCLDQVTELPNQSHYLPSTKWDKQSQVNWEISPKVAHRS